MGHGEHRSRAGVPEHVAFRTKPQLVIDMLGEEIAADTSNERSQVGQVVGVGCREPGVQAVIVAANEHLGSPRGRSLMIGFLVEPDLDDATALMPGQLRNRDSGHTRAPRHDLRARARTTDRPPRLRRVR